MADSGNQNAKEHVKIQKQRTNLYYTEGKQEVMQSKKKYAELY